MGLRNFLRTQLRESVTDRVSSGWQQHVSNGGQRDILQTAAAEAAGNLYGSAFAGATVMPDEAVMMLTPDLLYSMARGTIRNGEWVGAIEFLDGKMRIIEAADWGVASTSTNPNEWVYNLKFGTPSGTTAETMLGGDVVHLRYSTRPGHPDRGIGPLQSARSTSDGLASLEFRMARELNTAAKYALPVPSSTDQETTNLDQLAADLNSDEGGVFLVETTSSGWGEGRSFAPNRDWQPNRIGANPPATIQSLRSDLGASLLAACGVPASLLVAGSGGQAREARREFAYQSLRPFGRRLGAELSTKLNLEVRFDFGEWMQSDIAARARATHSLVQSEVDVERALELAGLGDS